MAKNKQIIDYFDDDFEVTYNEDLPHVFLNPDDDDYGDDYDNYNDHNDYDKYDDYNENDEYTQNNRHSSPKRPVNTSSHRARRDHLSLCGQNPDEPARRKVSASNDLASPLRAPIRTTTKFVENLTYFILRPAPAVLAALITLITVITFWNGHSTFGDPALLFAEGNYTLAAYLIVGGLLAFWEICSFLFALSGFRSGTGRGLTFFIVVYIGSYIASVADNLIPDTIPASLQVIDGIKSGLASFGSLYPMLFPLCAAGIVTCILKNIFSK